MTPARKAKKGKASSSHRKEGGPRRSIGSQDFIKRFTWEIASINVHLEDLRRFWARAIGLSGPQWMILMAISDLDKESGFPVKAVSKMLHVDPSFVTTQSKMLEKKGLLRRRPSPTDARMVQMSLTDRANRHLATFSAQTEALNEFVVEGFGEDELAELSAKLAALKIRLEKASLKVALDF